MHNANYSTFPARVLSFKSKWKGVDKLSPLSMAQAGFYCLNSSDSVKCYYCQKELEGWDEDDDPFIEHRNHQPQCPYVLMFDTPPESITVKQAISLEIDRLKFNLEKQFKAKMNKLEMAQKQ